MYLREARKIRSLIEDSAIDNLNQACSDDNLSIYQYQTRLIISRVALLGTRRMNR